ncbi:3-deoxy-D-manno-octulosonic acid transferase [Sulfitobacter sp. JBTF-M27]|uniref:3-deoxy-D-manno-octulosonic acid transferase n=1 Tax=Sulfitobacter sediminilitoris TaxID=2698830 RepID=A0A6P0C939_9RHOB|nr:glycosyltransferase N-terminal domain-containing protein [Sulfitobacter sediminilitoris]NEK22682.1 3-deoxy-D-manno-octulosonic acid transferase [Sulfitobacter sediminilitoris]
MARSLGLAAYRALTRRGEVPKDAPVQPRPKGELVWLHAGEVGNLLAVQDLAARLISTRTDLSVLITLPDDEASPTRSAPPRTDSAILQINAPSEHPAAVSAFLDHWSPDAAIWVWGGLRPNLILEATDRACPMFLIDADVGGFDKRRDRWLPDLTRQLLTRFKAVFARSAAGQRRLVQLGLLSDEVEQTSPLLAGGQALGCSDTDLTELSAAMGGRPAWFAAQLLPKEIPIILSAHKRASRLSHRLLLILQPSAPGQAQTAVDQATEQNLNVIRWEEGQFPDETTQVMVTDDVANQGLFFRVAPVSFLGSTLIQGEGGCDPLDAAALGSAILYGPRVRHFMASYSRLAAAGAARIVNDADALGAAVSTLIAPDHAATMAHAGWDVISQGAALTDKVVDLVQDTLDLELSRP